MAFSSMADIEKYMSEHNCHFYEAILHEEARDSLTDEQSIFDKMTSMYRVMKAADSDYDESLKSHSGLSGGNGAKMQKYADDFSVEQKKGALCGEFGSHVMATAIKMAESNACMKRIVASPTAGSCGVVPAVLINYENFYEKTDDFISDNGGKRTEKRMTEALLVAAGIGNVIAQRASISGAAGGCQAEIGTSSAMAAGALAYLRGGDEYISDAAAHVIRLQGLSRCPVLREMHPEP